MVTNPYESIVGKYFDCMDDPPQPASQCPSKTALPNSSGPYFNSSTGEWVCPLCYAIVHQDNEDEINDLFDDDEGAAFDNGEDFVAEGDSIQDQSREEGLRATRLTAIEEIVSILYPINLPFATHMTKNKYEIVDRLRLLEESQEEGFIIAAGRGLKVKLLAITVDLSGIPLRAQEIRLLGLRQSQVEIRLKVLNTLRANLSSLSPIVEKIYYVGKSIGLSKNILDIIVEQYEEASPLPNKEPNESARAAAWIYIKAKDSGIKGVTKKSLKTVPTVKSAPLDRAIESYRDVIQKRIKPVEGVPLLDVD